MGLIIRCIENGIISGLEFDLPVIAVIVTFAFGSICFQHITYHLELLGMTMRLSGCSMVFRKVSRFIRQDICNLFASLVFNSKFA